MNIKSKFSFLESSRWFRQHNTENYFSVLDGWRGLSILLVLATHLLPLGPKAWRLNEATGPLGMCLFFTLSGFLITNFLLHRPSVFDFIIRRFFRIIPLAWLYMLVTLPLSNASQITYLPHLLFYANLPPIVLTDVTGHLWSLCVEMQFYVGMAALFFLLRQKAFYFIPFIGFLFTFIRIYNDKYLPTIVTYYRIDEVFSGAILGIVYNNKAGELLPKFFSWVNPYIVILLLMIACHPDSGIMNCFRPYLSTTVVASTLYKNSNLVKWLNVKALVYIASISYALYVIHPLLAHTWLGSGDSLEKYAKRPLLFAILFLLAHVSTFHYEKHWIFLAKKITEAKK